MKKTYSLTDRIISVITGWIAGIVIVILAIWGIKTIWKYAHYEITDDAQVQEYVNPIIARSDGFIVDVKFEENQLVKKGDTLLIIDNREYALQESQTGAAISKEEAKLIVLDNNSTTLRKMASVTKSEIEGKKSKLWKQNLDYERYQKLQAEASATDQKLEDLKSTLEISKSEYQAANAQYEVALSKIEDNESEKLIIKADVERLRLLKNRNALDVSYTVILAPYDGRIGRRTVEKGQMIDRGQVLGFIIDNTTDKWVVANFKETQIAKMEVGDTATCIVDAFPDEEFKVTILSFSPGTGSSFSLLPPDNATGNFVKIVQRIPVRFKVEGDRKVIDKLKVGMNVNIYLPKKTI